MNEPVVGTAHGTRAAKPQAYDKRLSGQRLFRQIVMRNCHFFPAA
ncbi:hypothetical protein BGLA2_980028 [Burkholderia gladioli]|nr:hypothetical protein BGLA2_980028 [Burkholderia gladioli]